MAGGPQGLLAWRGQTVGVVVISIRAYTYMGHAVIESTCIHAPGSGGSHLLVRVERQQAAGDALELLDFLRDAADLAYTEALHGRVWTSDDCALA